MKKYNKNYKRIIGILILGLFITFAYGEKCKKPQTGNYCQDVQSGAPDCKITTSRVCAFTQVHKVCGATTAYYTGTAARNGTCIDGSKDDSCTTENLHCYMEQKYKCEFTKIGTCTYWLKGGIEYIVSVEGGVQNSIDYYECYLMEDGRLEKMGSSVQAFPY